jgi:hypothetical protein
VIVLGGTRRIVATPGAAARSGPAQSRLFESGVMDTIRLAAIQYRSFGLVSSPACSSSRINSAMFSLTFLISAPAAAKDGGGIEVGHRRMQLSHAGVDEHARIGMIDHVHVDRHPLALGQQIGNLDGAMVI